MATLIVDIETIGEEWNAFDDVAQHMLTKWTMQASRDEEKRSQLIEEIKNGLGLSPFTGRIISIGLYDVERKQGVVYYHDESLDIEFESGAFIFRSRTEKEMLVDFWEGAKNYDTFVTFCGRHFDIPFLNARSAIHEIRPSRDLLENKYLSQQKMSRHVDLQDQMMFYGALQKRPSLHTLCRAFGIESPKRSGVSGENIAELFRMKKFRDIAHDNARDVTATLQIYEKWLKYLAPYSFLNTDE